MDPGLQGTGRDHPYAFLPIPQSDEYSDIYLQLSRAATVVIKTQ